MPDLHQIPHLDEIAHHGEYHGVGKRVTETFADRYHHQNKVVPSLEDAIRLTGLRDGMTISFHHHFRNGDHIVNMVLDKLAEMGFHDLKLAASSLSAIHAPLIRHIQNGVITHIETSGMRGELAEAVSRGLMDCRSCSALTAGAPLPSARVSCTSTSPSSVRRLATPTAMPTAISGRGRGTIPAAAAWAMPAPIAAMPAIRSSSPTASCPSPMPPSPYRPALWIPS